MNRDKAYLLAMTCAIPAILAIIKSNRIDKKFYPFIFLMLLDVTTETLIRYVDNKALYLNVYFQLSFALFLWFMFINGFIRRNSLLLFLPVIPLAIANIFYYDILCKPFMNTDSNFILLKSCYLFCYTGVITLYISIDVFARQISAFNQKLVDNPWFWIGGAYSISVAYNLLIFSLIIFALSDTDYGKSISNIQKYVNAFSYVLFTIAVLKMSNSRNNTLASSRPGKINTYAA